MFVKVALLTKEAVLGWVRTPTEEVKVGKCEGCDWPLADTRQAEKRIFLNSQVK